jgi:PPK2 family polyphosphate:nucleotide phosphotransferase
VTSNLVDLEAYRVPATGVRLADRDPADTQGNGRTDAVRERFAANRDRLDELQVRLYAEGAKSLLLVLQAMDTGGKDSCIRRVTEGINPQGCRVVPFKVPCPHELAHDFLWRVHPHVPARGMIGIFNRSHYEDVLVVKVRQLASADVVERRYHHLVEFERVLADAGTRIVKVMLHISKDYQAEQLRERVTDPAKQWKFNPGDLEERQRWDDYMAAYETALGRTSTDWAPWYVVPAENKWWRDLVVSELLRRALEDIDPRFPPPRFDPAAYPPSAIV